MQGPSTARQQNVLNASRRVHRLSPLPPSPLAFAESMVGGISRWFEIAARTNRKDNFLKAWGVTVLGCGLPWPPSACNVADLAR